MMASGENRFSSTMWRQMPVSAQSGDSLGQITVTSQSQSPTQSGLGLSQSQWSQAGTPGLGSDPGFAGSPIDQISEIQVTANGAPPPGTPTPPENIPGGPWQWTDNGTNPRGGQFYGPKQPRGPRGSLTWSPPTPNQRGYWKATPPSGPAQRYFPWGDPMSPDQKQWGTSPFDGPSVPPFAPWAFFLWALGYSDPAY
jgi:hypothetical protein